MTSIQRKYCVKNYNKVVLQNVTTL